MGHESDPSLSLARAQKVVMAFSKWVKKWSRGENYVSTSFDVFGNPTLVLDKHYYWALLENRDIILRSSYKQEVPSPSL